MPLETQDLGLGGNTTQGTTGATSVVTGGPGGDISKDEFMAEVPLVDKALQLEALFDQSKLMKKGYPKYESYTNSVKQQDIVETISPERPEPLATFNLSRNSIIGGKDSLLYSSCLQALIEDRVSLEYAAALIKKIKLENPDFFTEMSKEIQKEVDDAQNAIIQLNNIFDILVVSDQALNPTLKSTKDTCSNFASQMYESLKIDSEPLIENLEIGSPDQLLFDLAGKNHANRIETKTRTALVCQLLHVVDSCLSNCMSGLSIGLDPIHGGQSSIPEGSNSLNIMTSPPMMANMKTLGANSNLNLVYGIAEYSYVDLQFYGHLDIFTSPEERVLGMCTMLSNEMALSAGLGRVIDTQDGNRFGAESKDFTVPFLGIKNLAGADIETAVPGSLVDYLAVNNVGEPNGHMVKAGAGNIFFPPTLLLDGTFAGRTDKTTNTFDSFMKSVARNPDDNSISNFSKGLNNCKTAFLSGIDFYKKVHLKDKKPDLLTPRGLFSRLIFDMSECMDQLGGSKTQIDANLACELAVLKTISESSGEDTHSHAGRVKHFMLGIIVRKAAAILSGKSYDVPKSPPPSENTTNVKIITKGKAGSDQFTIVTSQENEQDPYTPDDKIPQFAASPSFEKNLLSPSWMTWFHVPTFTAWADLAQNSSIENDSYDAHVKSGNQVGSITLAGKWGSTSGYTNLVMDLMTFVQDYAALEGTVIDRVAKIFVEMCQEAEKFAQSESEDGSWLDEMRLSRNSGVSGTLLLSTLFESALEVIGMTIDGGLTYQMEFGFQEADYLGGVEAVDDDRFKGYPLNFAVRTGKATSNAIRSKALRLLSLASDSDSFESLEDQEMIPDLSYGAESVPGSNCMLTHSGKDINNFVNYFRRLDEDRELPLKCLFSAMSVIDQTNHGTTSIQNIGKMLRGDLPPDTLALALSNFSVNDKTKDPAHRFLENVSDHSLKIAQERLDRIKLSLVKSTGRLEKIRAGEVACIKIMLDHLITNGSYPNYLFYVVGLPADFITTEILPAFSLSTGKEGQGVNTAYITSTVSKTETFTNAMFTTYKRSFFSSIKINSKSFDVFETTAPTSEDEMLASIVFKDGTTGSSFMKKNDLPGDLTPKQVLRAEVYSYLMKKLFSTISTADLNENNLVKYDYDQRSAGSKNTARIFAKAAGINETEFDDIFEENDQNTIINWQTLLQKTAYPYNGDTIAMPTLTHAQAELFYDIFSSIYFMTGKVHNKVFAPSVFDKTVGMVMTAGDFENISESSSGDDPALTGVLQDVLFDEFDVNVMRAGEENGG